MMSALSLLQPDDDDSNGREYPLPQFPNHEAPRTWLLTAADSPIGIILIRQLLEHGDNIVAAVSPDQYENPSDGFEELTDEIDEIEEWSESFLVFPLNSRYGWLQMKPLLG